MASQCDNPYQPTFAFALGEKVDIQGTGCSGEVVARAEYISGSKDYRVVYWHNGSRNDIWFSERELVKPH